MITTPMDILCAYPRRTSKCQQKRFCEAVISYLSGAGFPAVCDAQNSIVIGNPQSAKYLLAARYDTTVFCDPDPQSCSLIAILEILASLPQNQQDRVCAVLYSGKLRIRDPQRFTTIFRILGLGKGNELRLIPGKKLWSDHKMLQAIYDTCGKMGCKRITVSKVPGNFPGNELRICGITGKKDTLLYTEKFGTDDRLMPMNTNINILRAALISLICGKALD